MTNMVLTPMVARGLVLLVVCILWTMMFMKVIPLKALRGIVMTAANF